MRAPSRRRLEPPAPVAAAPSAPAEPEAKVVETKPVETRPIEPPAAETRTAALPAPPAPVVEPPAAPSSPPRPAARAEPAAEIPAEPAPPAPVAQAPAPTPAPVEAPPAAAPAPAPVAQAPAAAPTKATPPEPRQMAAAEPDNLVVFLAVRADIRSVRQLAGKPVAMGKPAPGSQGAMVQDAFASAGVNPRAVELAGDEAIKALIDGKVAAATVLIGPPMRDSELPALKADRSGILQVRWAVVPRADRSGADRPDAPVTRPAGSPAKDPRRASWRAGRPRRARAPRRARDRG